jgi:hypothetical protein
MRINDYALIDPKGSEAGKQLSKLASDHPIRAARLVDCLEAFVVADTDLAHGISEGQTVFYLVPPRFVLASIPDAAALVRVDHAKRRVEIVQIIEEYGGVQERVQWAEIVVVARRLGAGA